MLDLQAELVKCTRHDEVDEVVDRLGAVVEAGGEKQHGRPRLLDRKHVPQMDEGQRRLARHEDELPLLLEGHRGGAMNEIRHGARGDRPERAHRARADHVRVDLRRPARVGRLPVVRLVDGDVAALRVLEHSGERLVARQPWVAVELGRQHLDPGARRADAELDVRGSQCLNEASRVRGARGARYAEEDAHRGPISGPWIRSGTRRADAASAVRARRTSASRCCRTSTGLQRTWRRTPAPDRFFPIADRSGAPRLELPVPR